MTQVKQLPNNQKDLQKQYIVFCPWRCPNSFDVKEKLFMVLIKRWLRQTLFKAGGGGWLLQWGFIVRERDEVQLQIQGKVEVYSQGAERESED